MKLTHPSPLYFGSIELSIGAKGSKAKQNEKFFYGIGVSTKDRPDDRVTLNGTKLGSSSIATELTKKLREKTLTNNELQKAAKTLLLEKLVTLDKNSLLNESTSLKQEFETREEIEALTEEIEQLESGKIKRKRKITVSKTKLNELKESIFERDEKELATLKVKLERLTKKLETLELFETHKDDFLDFLRRFPNEQKAEKHYRVVRYSSGESKANQFHLLGFGEEEHFPMKRVKERSLAEQRKLLISSLYSIVIKKQASAL